MGSAIDEYRPMRAVIAARAETVPDRIYVHAIEQDKDLTYGALRRVCNQMAQYFADRGLGANDRVVMLSENSVEFMATFLGVQRFGATIATANVEMNRDHIAEILTAVRPKLVLIQDGLGLEDTVHAATDAVAESLPISITPHLASLSSRSSSA